MSRLSQQYSDLLVMPAIHRVGAVGAHFSIPNQGFSVSWRSDRSPPYMFLPFHG